ncbi:MAG: right-handed parallel beta-helix repeat-containing protein [Gammaproteobacteria bacterium]
MTLSAAILLCGLVQGPVTVFSGNYVSKCRLTISNAQIIGKVDTQSAGALLQFPLPDGIKIRQVYINNALQTPAKYPNGGFIYPPYNVGNGLLWHVREHPWKISEAIDGIGITVTKDTGAYFTGQEWMLDNPGEWFQDGNILKLRADRSGKIEIVPEGPCLSIYSQQNVTVDNVNFDKCDIAIKTLNSTNVTIRNVNITNVFSGIVGWNQQNGSTLIEKTNISNAEKDGILFWGESGLIAKKNVISNIGLSKSWHRSFGAIGGSGAIRIEKNKIRNVAYTGISQINTNDVIINKNKLSNVCLRFGDCGGIYVVHSQHAQIYDNKLNHGSGSLQGLRDGWHFGVGIYYDESSHDGHAWNNTISDFDWATFAHNSDNVLFE